MDEQTQKDVFDQAKKNTKSTILITLVIIIGFTIYSFFSGSGGVSGINFGDDEATFSSSTDEGYSFSVPYSSVKTVEYFTDEISLGERLEGTEARRLVCGKYQNDIWGTYYLYASPTVDTYCVIDTDSGYAVINFESDESTEAFVDAFQRLMVEENYWQTAAGR